MNIVIVGGGTAGWLAALMITKVKPEHTVTLIESSAIGIVGAGEGSTGMLTSIINGSLWDFDCDLMEFLKETGATLKYGIKHKGWSPNIDRHYLAPLSGSGTSGNSLDYLFALEQKLNPDKLHLTNDLGILMDRNLSSFNLKTFDFDHFGNALHFDAHKVGQYFKKKVLKNPNVNLVDDEIIEVNLKENGFIDSVKLKSEKVIEGDFFIDASGFSRVLMKKLNNPWVSYNKYLPVNSAMPFLLDYDDSEMPEPWTTAWAQSSGWMWQIPVQERKGCGYVFDSNFITPEKAHEELEITLGKKINPIQVLKFDTGRLEKAWVNNCLAIGLASAFAEPLEATSIHSTIMQLIGFVFEFLKLEVTDTVNSGSINIYNNRTSQMYDDFKDFLVVHYMGGRTDSEFWKYIATGATQTDFVKDILLMCNHRMPSNHDFKKYAGSTDWGLWSYVLAGTGRLSSEICKKELINASVLPDGNTMEELAIATRKNMLSNFENKIKNNMPYDKFINYIKR
jgi:tryptophan halogenase